MKTTRRTFLGLLSALTLTAKDAFGFFRKKETPTAEIEVTYSATPHHVPCCYIYNAGMDFEGVGSQTFGRLNVIRGGVITKITDLEEHIAHEAPPLTHGASMRIEKVVTGVANVRFKALDIGPRIWPTEEGVEPEPLVESRTVIIHPALETSDSLVIYSRGQIIPLPFWNDKEVDLEGVNALISADTFRERIGKAEAVARRQENWAYQLSQMCVIVLEEQRERLRKRLTRDLQRPWGLDTFEQRACHLLEWDIAELAKQTLLAHR